jgi:hypothetical protein
MKPINYAVYIPGNNCVLDGVNQPVCSTIGNTNARRIFRLENPAVGRFFGPVNEIDAGSNASYHGMLLSLQRVASRGITINANYTWSHCIADFTNGTINLGTGNDTYPNPLNRRESRADCVQTGSDRRHLFNVTAVMEAPQFSTSAVRAIAGGWKLSPILRLQSGPPLTVTTGTDIALNGAGNQRVNQISEQIYGDKTAANYLNRSAFALPETGTLGNLGRSAIRGPGFWQLDVALSRSFQPAENQRIEFRAEAFNLTNSVRKNPPVTAFNNNQFGRITSAADPRIVQFSAKYVF